MQYNPPLPVKKILLAKKFNTRQQYALLFPI